MATALELIETERGKSLDRSYGASRRAKRRESAMRDGLALAGDCIRQADTIEAEARGQEQFVARAEADIKATQLVAGATPLGVFLAYLSDRCGAALQRTMFTRAPGLRELEVEKYRALAEIAREGRRIFLAFPEDEKQEMLTKVQHRLSEQEFTSLETIDLLRLEAELRGVVPTQSVVPHG